jgi:dedicator of cytokinesis protein 3
LAEILKHQATLYGHITSEQRYYPDYFKVTYYGDFPAAIRNKHVIVRLTLCLGSNSEVLTVLYQYRGYEWEKFGAFCERMLNKHLGARLLKGSGDPPPDIRFGNDQYIQCASVTPEPNRDHPVFNSTDVPSQVKAYYEHKYDT